MWTVRAVPLLTAALCAATPARAAPLELVYSVRAGGGEVLQVEVMAEFTAQGYRLDTVVRTRGLLALFVTGEQTARAEGRWRGAEPVPRIYHAEGRWRGRLHRVLMEYQEREPRLRALEPPNEGEHDEVPSRLRLGTVDALSGMVKLARVAGATGRCNGSTTIFDGRRRLEWTAQSLGEDRMLAAGGAWTGQAMRCAFESRQTAGFRRDQARSDAALRTSGLIWLATVRPDAPPVPVRMEMPSRWFGTMEAVLVRIGPLQRQAVQ